MKSDESLTGDGLYKNPHKSKWKARSPCKVRPGDESFERHTMSQHQFNISRPLTITLCSLSPLFISIYKPFICLNCFSNTIRTIQTQEVFVQ